VADSFDPERLRCAEPAAAPSKRPRIPLSSQPFVKMPKLWIEVLATIPKATAATYRVAFHLVEEAWRSTDRTVKLTNAKVGGVPAGQVQGHCRFTEGWPDCRTREG
jgi:hypothetical protein